MLLDAFASELPEFWPIERELLASILEVLHSLLIVTMKAYGAKRTPPPLRVPRPGSVVTSDEVKVISMAEYARQFGGE